MSGVQAAHRPARRGSARRGDGTLIRNLGRVEPGLRFCSQMFRFCDRDLVVAAALGDEHRLTQSDGGYADRPVAGRSVRGQFGLLVGSACQFTTGRAARPHVA